MKPWIGFIHKITSMCGKLHNFFIICELALYVTLKLNWPQRNLEFEVVLKELWQFWILQYLQIQILIQVLELNWNLRNILNSILNWSTNLSQALW